MSDKHTAVAQVTTETARPLAHEHTLDVRNPVEWQMKVRLHLESLNAADSEQWMDGIRLISQMAGSVVRDNVYRRTTQRCYVCGGPFKEGRNAGDAGYYDADRNWVAVRCCDQSEFSDLLKACHKKEEEIRLAQERADRAAKQAAQDARRAINTREARG